MPRRLAISANVPRDIRVKTVNFPSMIALVSRPTSNVPTLTLSAMSAMESKCLLWILYFKYFHSLQIINASHVLVLNVFTAISTWLHFPVASASRVTCSTRAPVCLRAPVPINRAGTEVPALEMESLTVALVLIASVGDTASLSRTVLNTAGDVTMLCARMAAAVYRVSAFLPLF